METATQYIKMNDFKIMTFFKKNTWQLNVLISNINCPKLKVLNSNPRLLSYFSYFFVYIVTFSFIVRHQHRTIIYQNPA